MKRAFFLSLFLGILILGGLANANKAKPPPTTGTPAEANENSGEQNASEAPQYEKLLQRLQGCTWVDSIYKPGQLATESAYFVKGCEPANSQGLGGTLICTGTLACNFATHSETGVVNGKATIYFENVMCAGNGMECPAADSCLRDSGYLKSAKLKGNINKTTPVLYQPKPTQGVQ